MRNANLHWINEHQILNNMIIRIVPFRRRAITIADGSKIKENSSMSSWNSVVVAKTGRSGQLSDRGRLFALWSLMAQLNGRENTYLYFLRLQATYCSRSGCVAQGLKRHTLATPRQWR